LYPPFPYSYRIADTEKFPKELFDEFLRVLFIEFKDLIFDSIDDIKLFFGLVKTDRFTQRARKVETLLYDIKKFLFKNLVINTIEDSCRNRTEEEYVKLLKRLKDAKNPKIYFNKVRR
jgi:hypothetical protein